MWKKKLVAYAPRSMTQAEMRYVCTNRERRCYHYLRRVNAFPYILSKIIATEADHKPLVPLLSTTFQSASLPSSIDEI